MLALIAGAAHGLVVYLIEQSARIIILTNRLHLYNMFENERFFSHLSPLERELSFRTEMVNELICTSGRHGLIKCVIF